MPYTLTSARAARASSLAQLSACLPELREREALLDARCQMEGIVYRIADFGGMRNVEQTARILRYREADYRAAIAADPRVARIPITVWRAIAPYGQSRHNFGAAFDVEPLAWPLGMTYGGALERIALLAPLVNLRNGASFRDIRHQELPDALPLLRVRYLAFAHQTVGKVGVGAVAVAAIGVLLLVARGIR